MATIASPPGIAWQIGLGCKLFGNTELGVRFFAIVLGFLESVAVYALARECALSEQRSRGAALAIAFSPLGMMGAMLAVTDGGLVLFWTLASALFARGLREEKVPPYWSLGAALFCGACFKWPIYLLFLFFLPFLYAYPFLRSSRFFGAAALSLLALIPSLMWNRAHDFATFRHVWYTVIQKQREAGTTPLATGNAADFIASQALLLSPLLFFLLIWALIWSVRSWRSVSLPLKFCVFVTLGLLFPYTIVSFFKKMQGNWVVFAYPTAAVLIAATASARWLKRGVASAAVLSLICLSIPFVQAHELLPLPYRLNPFVHYMGWDGLGPLLMAKGFDPKEHFLFSDKYQMSSILSFYSGEQRRAYFLNMQRSRKNQFSFWPGLKEEQLGKTGYFVLVENVPYLRKASQIIEKERRELERYFAEVECLGVEPLFTSGGEVVKAAIIFRCEAYNGALPEETTLY